MQHQIRHRRCRVQARLLINGNAYVLRDDVIGYRVAVVHKRPGMAYPQQGLRHRRHDWDAWDPLHAQDFPLEITDPASIEKLVERISKVDLLINNAGSSQAFKTNVSTRNMFAS